MSSNETMNGRDQATRWRSSTRPPAIPRPAGAILFNYVLLALGVCGDPSLRAEPPVFERGFNVSSRPDGVLVREGEQNVFFYQRLPKSLDGRFARSNYIHPLYDLEGNVLTEDFPADHLHHRGIFWAWHQLWVGDQRVADPWLTTDFQADVQHVSVSFAEDQSVILKSDVDWKSTRWTDDHGRPKALVRELLMVRAHPRSDTYRAIDFQIELLARSEGVRIGGSEDDKGYGGFSVRLRLPEDVTFASSVGTIRPERLAIEAGPWIDVSGSYGKDGSRHGVTILCHPSLPKFPPAWILRQQRSMQNPVYPGREPVELSTTRPLKLAYRLIVHSGQAKRQQIENWQQDFAGQHGIGGGLSP